MKIKSIFINHVLLRSIASIFFVLVVSYQTSAFSTCDNSIHNKKTVSKDPSCVALKVGDLHVKAKLNKRSNSRFI